MRIRLTGTGGLFLAMAVVLYFSAFTSLSSLLLLLAGVVLGCLLVNLVVAWNTVRNVEIHAPPSVQICEGERLSQPWRITNHGKRAASFIQAESQAKVIFRLGALAGGAQANVVPDLVFTQRGVFPFNHFSLASIAPFGLIKAARRCQLPGEVVIGPAIYHTAIPRAAGYDVTLGGKFKGHRPTTSGTYFAGVRPFQDGDPLKQIHWKSSAKGLGLMVKTFEEELSGRISFILDNGRADRPEILDDCARAAGSLMFAALEAGHHVELIDLEGLQPLLVPPFADGGEILDALARLPLAASLSAPAPDAALDLVSKRGAICFVLTACTPAIASSIDYLLDHHRQVSLYLPAGGPPLPGPVGVPVFTYSDHAIAPTA